MVHSTSIVTVFGGSGFIGRHLIRRLAKTGAMIRVASRHPSRAQFLKPAGNVGQIVPIATDITNDHSVAMAVTGASTVVNLIGVLYESSRWRFDAVHAEAPRRIGMAARLAGVERLVHVSAIGADLNSPAAYARSKAAGEANLRSVFPEATILRPSVLFGPEDNFLNMFGGLALMSPVLPLLGGGQTRFQPVYVGDVADAIIAALAAPDAAGKTYELGGPRVYTFKELLVYLLEQIRRKRLLVPVPFGLARLKASVLELLPSPMLTRDQVELLKKDNVVADNALTLKDLGVAATALEVIAPSYLDRFRPGGRYSRTQTA